jgi:hypothetical protein
MRLRLFVVDWVPEQPSEFKPIAGMDEDWKALAPEYRLDPRVDVARRA